MQSDPLRIGERTKAVQSDLGTVMVKRRAIVATGNGGEKLIKSFGVTLGATACGGPTTSLVPSCASSASARRIDYLVSLAPPSGDTHRIISTLRA